MSASDAGIERLELELERLEKRLKRKRLSDNEHNIKIAKSRVERARNNLAFVVNQTPDKIQSCIASCENKQLLLQEQIEALQRQVRFYSDLVLNRTEIEVEARLEVSRTQLHLDQLQGKASAPPTVDSVSEKFALLQKMMG